MTTLASHFASLALVGLLAGNAAWAQAPAHTFVRQGGDWYRVEPAGLSRVNPEIISVRFQAPIADLAQFLAAEVPMPGSVGAAIAGLETVRSNRLGVHDLRLPAGADLFAVLDALRATGRVEFAEENTFGHFLSTPNDPLYGASWYLNNTGQSGGTPGVDVGAELAWNVTAGSPSIVIAVIDSGTEITHPDLAANIRHNSGEIPGNGIDDDSNGFVDDVDGWDFAGGDNQVDGSFWHGTMVAGCVAARTNNATGVAGLAGGFTSGDGCRVMVVKIGDTEPDNSVIDDAILYAADNGARVINFSGAAAQNSAIDAALNYAYYVKGVFIACAAGTFTPGGALLYPATEPTVVAVGATDRFDIRYSYSAIGPQLWVCAPGVQINSTGLGGTYITRTGTSFSAPLVAATAGLMLSVMPSLTPLDLKQILKLTARDLAAPGFDDGTGWGGVSAYGAVLHVLNSDCNGNGIYDPTDITTGTSLDVNLNGVPDECEPGGGTPYCFGDGSGTACPCANHSAVGAGEGCLTSIAVGGKLRGAGGTSLTNDTLVLFGTQMPSAPALYFQGTAQVSAGAGTTFGDGKRCAGGTVVRLKQITNVGGASQYPQAGDPPVSVRGLVAAPGIRTYQIWFRNNAVFCTLDGWNLTNGVEVNWLP